MSKWTSQQLPDFSGRTVVITGASSGIGLVAANELARCGASVVAGVRNVDRATKVLPESVDVRQLDLASLASVRTFAESFDGPVDVLVNNAGVMAVPLSRTADGFEMQFGTNHLGHFALTGLLLGRIRDRVVTVSSTAHRLGRLRLDDPNWQNSYNAWGAYGWSKLSNLLFTRELQRRLDGSGSSVRAIAVHPGYAATHLQSHAQSRVQRAVMRAGNRLLAQSAEAGAWPTLYGAALDVPGGSFIGPDGLAQLRGHPVPVSSSRVSRDRDAARRLWELSEDLTQVHFDFSASRA